MPVRRMLAGMLAAAAIVGAAQYLRQGNRWAKYEHEMQTPVNDPPDAREPAEFAFARLRFRSPRDGFGGYGRRHLRWGTDTNKSDRIFMQAIRRLTRIHTRSIEEVVDIDEDEMFNWPFLYAVGVGDWQFTDAQAKRLRRYFDNGGFLMVDDFHNEREWAVFMTGIHKIFPEREAVEIPDDHGIWTVAYDVRERHHIPGYNIVYGQPWERGGIGEHYRAILDERGRVVVAICFNMDLGDAWEWADVPEFPEKVSALALRVGVNYVLYDMTH